MAFAKRYSVRMLQVCVAAFITHAVITAGHVRAEQSSVLDPKLPAADYGSQKKQVQDRAQRLKQSQLVQDVSSTYREMVASFKARQIEHAEELSQELDNLLDDPLLPVAFAEKMRKKQQNFLERVYGKEDRLITEIPVDKITDEELPAIRERMSPQRKISEVLPASGEVMVESGQAPTVSLAASEPAQPEPKKKKEKKAKQQKISSKEKLATEEVQQTALPKTTAETRRDHENDRQTALKQRKQAEEDLRKYADQSREGEADGLLQVQRLASEERQQKIDNFLKKYRSEMMVRRKDLQTEFDLRIEELYRDGMEFYKNRAYRMAWDLLSEVERLSPGYKDVRRVLDSIRIYVEEELAHERQQEISSVLDEYQQSAQE